MTFAENVNSLLGACLNTFGQAVEYQDKDNFYHDLTGIFSNEYEGIDPDTGFPVISSIPNLGIRLSDWPKIPEEGEFIFVNCTQYKVRYPVNDGEGGAVIFLDKVM